MASLKALQSGDGGPLRLDKTFVGLRVAVIAGEDASSLEAARVFAHYGATVFVAEKPGSGKVAPPLVPIKGTLPSLRKFGLVVCGEGVAFPDVHYTAACCYSGPVVVARASDWAGMACYREASEGQWKAGLAWERGAPCPIAPWRQPGAVAPPPSRSGPLPKEIPQKAPAESDGKVRKRREGGGVAHLKDGSEMDLNNPEYANELASELAQKIKSGDTPLTAYEKKWVAARKLTKGDVKLRWRMKALAAKSGYKVQKSDSSGYKYPSNMTFVLKAIGKKSLAFRWESLEQMRARGAFRKAVELKLASDASVNKSKKSLSAEDRERLVLHNIRGFENAYRGISECVAKHGQWLDRRLA
jgi:hypothetical protein